MTKNLEKRLYTLTMRNIGVLDKGIQSLHATVEYQLKYPKDKEYISWATNHKTVIILDGGTSVTMDTHAQYLESINYKHAIFREPDLNNSLTAIAMVFDETIYDTEKYPFDLLDSIYFENPNETVEEEIKNEILWQVDDDDKKTYKLIGVDGLRIRKFIKQFQLAR